MTRTNTHETTPKHTRYYLHAARALAGLTLLAGCTDTTPDTGRILPPAVCEAAPTARPIDARPDFTSRIEIEHSYGKKRDHTLLKALLAPGQTKAEKTFWDFVREDLPADKEFAEADGTPHDYAVYGEMTFSPDAPDTAKAEAEAVSLALGTQAAKELDLPLANKSIYAREDAYIAGSIIVAGYRRQPDLDICAA